MEEDIWYRLNKLLSSPALDSILNVFDPDSYIRLNMVYISPVHLPNFKAFLNRLGLIEIFIHQHGIGYIFRNFRLNFYGTTIVTYKNNGKIWCIEVNFDPTIDENCGIPIMNEIEQFLKGCDTLFFMTYFVDIDKEILHSSLVDSVEFIYKRNKLRNKKM